MSASAQRVADAFAFRAPDRTPLFEIYSPFHPIYWDMCGQTPATDAGMYWDALAEGITSEELLELSIDAQYRINRYFEVDMVRFNGPSGKSLLEHPHARRSQDRPDPSSSWLIRPAGCRCLARLWGVGDCRSPPDRINSDAPGRGNWRQR